MFKFWYILWTVGIKCIGNQISAIIFHNLFSRNKIKCCYIVYETPTCICIIFLMYFLELPNYKFAVLTRSSSNSVVSFSEWLQAGRPRGRSSNHGRVTNFLFSTSSRRAMGPTQPLIQWVTGALSPGLKRSRREADHSAPTSAEVMKTWIYTSTPSYAFMAYCLISYAHGQLYLLQDLPLLNPICSSLS
jgi:hypothetical protein